MWKVFFTTFGLVFLAELGDKTQLATMLMATQCKATWAVFLGSAAALVLSSLIGVLAGSLIVRYVPIICRRRPASVLLSWAGCCSGGRSRVSQEFQGRLEWRERGSFYPYRQHLPQSHGCQLFLPPGPGEGRMIWLWNRPVWRPGRSTGFGTGHPGAGRRGIDLREHRAQQVTREMIEDADLILTMTWDQREAVLQLVPQAQGKVFTLKEMDPGPDLKGVLSQWEELGRQLEAREEEFFQEHGEEITRLKERRDRLAGELAEVEGHLQDWEARLKAATAEERRQLQKMAASLRALDIRDPFGQPVEVYRATFQEIRRYLASLLAKFRGGNGRRQGS